MFRKFLCLLVAVVFCVPALAQEPEKKPENKPESKSEITWSDAKAAESGASMSHWSSTKRLDARGARKMGITVITAARALKELKAAGEITSENMGEAAPAIAAKLYEKNKDSWGDAKAINWDNLIAFIERLIPLIERIIDALTSYDVGFEGGNRYAGLDQRRESPSVPLSSFAAGITTVPSVAA